MRQITLGTTGITVPQNAFGCLPIQRVSKEEAVHLLRRAYAGGMRFFDTARAYSDSEEKVGAAFGSSRSENFAWGISSGLQLGNSRSHSYTKLRTGGNLYATMFTETESRIKGVFVLPASCPSICQEIIPAPSGATAFICIT